MNVKCKDDAFWDDYDNNYNANRAITITNKKNKYSLLAKKTSKNSGFLEVYLYLCKQIFRY